MTEGPTHRTDGSDRYAIRVKGHLHPRWAPWFDGFSLTGASDGTTVLAGWTDQAGLHGVLRTLNDLGLPLVSVTPLAAEEPSTTSSGSAGPPPSGSSAPGSSRRPSSWSAS